ATACRMTKGSRETAALLLLRGSSKSFFATDLRGYTRIYADKARATGGRGALQILLYPCKPALIRVNPWQKAFVRLAGQRQYGRVQTKQVVRAYHRPAFLIWTIT